MESLFFDGFTDFYEAEDAGGELRESVIIDDDVPVAGEIIEEDKTFSKVKGESSNETSETFSAISISDYGVGDFVSRGLLVGGSLILIQLSIILIISILRKAGT